jgi:hypothetical protein
MNYHDQTKVSKVSVEIDQFHKNKFEQISENI